MRKFKVLTVFVVCLFIVSASAKANGFRTGYSDYEIEAVENVNLGKGIEKVWNLTYSGSEKPITVVKRNTAEGAFYVINSEFFEVCYSSTSKGFGVRTVKKAWSSVPRQLNDVVLNPDEIKRQQIISPNKVDDQKALGLIASYLPDLLNDNYTHLLN